MRRAPGGVISAMTAVWSYLLPVSAVSMVSTLCGSNPGATLVQRGERADEQPRARQQYDRERHFDHHQHTARLGLTQPGPEREADSLSAKFRSARDAWMAGARPKSTPVASDRSSVKRAPSN